MHCVRYLRAIAACLLVFSSVAAVKAQQTACPTNIDFELGSLANWTTYIGNNAGYGTTTGNIPFIPSAALPTRHAIVSGSAVDAFGNFPVVAPGAGTYSMKLGNSSTGAEMEAIRYVISVPAGVNNYSLIYRYAVVFEDPSHSTNEQPFFRVLAYDSATGISVNCANFTYISSSSLPGFTQSTVRSQVYYKSWSTASLNLSGQAGRKIIVEFNSADCSIGGHFGYGYIDMNCGLFAISSNACAGSAQSPLSAPPGFQNYAWWDAGYTTLLGTGQNISVPTPTTPTTYHVVLTPFAGFGCKDTLTTQIISSDLRINPSPDTTVCNADSVQLSGSFIGNVPPFTYRWTPAAGLSCTACNNPMANPAVNTNYVFSVSDATGCTRYDTIRVLSKPTPGASTVSNVSCFGGNDGAITATGVNGTPPYTYSWATTPVQTTSQLNNLRAGSYRLSVTDAAGCTNTAAIQVTEPPLLSVSITNNTTSSCYNGVSGNAVASVNGGTPPYSYSWNTTPPQTGAQAIFTAGGNFRVTVTDSKGCTTSDTMSIQYYPRPQIFAGPDTILCAGKSVSLHVSGAATYTWSPAGGLSCTTCADPVAAPVNTTTYTVIGVDTNGCLDTGRVVVTVIPKLNVSIAPEIKTCRDKPVSLQAEGGIAYEWSPAADLDDPHSPAPVATPRNTTNYQVIITENQCFKDTLQQLLTIFDPPTLDLEPGYTVLPGVSVALAPKVAYASYVTWTPDTWLSCSRCFTTYAAPQTSMTYLATAHNDIGCVASDSVHIKVSCDGSVFYMPNLFTPNADGNNDFFYPQGHGVTTVHHFRVIDRWGEVVFSADNFPVNDERHGWDGTYKNNALKPDVYLYIVEATCLNGDPLILKGDITLIR